MSFDPIDKSSIDKVAIKARSGRALDTTQSTSKSNTKSPYNHRWRKARESYLKRNPLCTMCEMDGRIMAATVVDHIVPHKGDRELFWQQSNWQPLCERHHNAAKQKQERTGFSSAVDNDGWPTDSNHPANRIGRGRGGSA